MNSSIRTCIAVTASHLRHKVLRRPFDHKVIHVVAMPALPRRSASRAELEVAAGFQAERTSLFECKIFMSAVLVIQSIRFRGKGYIHAVQLLH